MNGHFASSVNQQFDSRVDSVNKLHYFLVGRTECRKTRKTDFVTNRCFVYLVDFSYIRKNYLKVSKSYPTKLQFLSEKLDS